MGSVVVVALVAAAASAAATTVPAPVHANPLELRAQDGSSGGGGRGGGGGGLGAAGGLAGGGPLSALSALSALLRLLLLLRLGRSLRSLPRSRPPLRDFSLRRDDGGAADAPPHSRTRIRRIARAARPPGRAARRATIIWIGGSRGSRELSR